MPVSSAVVPTAPESDIVTSQSNIRPYPVILSGELFILSNSKLIITGIGGLDIDNPDHPVNRAVPHVIEETTPDPPSYEEGSF